MSLHPSDVVSLREIYYLSLMSNSMGKIDSPSE